MAAYLVMPMAPPASTTTLSPDSPHPPLCPCSLLYHISLSLFHLLLVVCAGAPMPRPLSARLQRFARVLPHRAASTEALRTPSKRLSLTDRWARLYSTARSLGLSAHGAASLRHHWRGLPQPAILERATQLLQHARAQADAANVSDPQKLGTSLKYFGDFCAAFAGRDMFQHPRWRGDLEAEAYNEATFSMYAQFLREGADPPLKSGTISGHVAVLRQFVERELGCTLLPPPCDQRLLPRLFKAYRASDGPGARKLVLALRGRHLRALAGTLPQTYEGTLDWAILTVGHNFLTRGGELGRPDGIPFRPEQRMLTLSSDCVQFGSMPLPPPGGGAPVDTSVVVVWLMPLKDGAKRRKPVPMLLAQRAFIEGQHDPLCAYTALRSRSSTSG